MQEAILKNFLLDIYPQLNGLKLFSLKEARPHGGQGGVSRPRPQRGQRG